MAFAVYCTIQQAQNPGLLFKLGGQHVAAAVMQLERALESKNDHLIVSTSAGTLATPCQQQAMRFEK